MAYNSSSILLPDCNSITAAPCAPCLFAAQTKYLEFPYNLTSTVTVTVYPVYTGLPGSSTFVSYETDSITVTLSENGKPIPTFGGDLTWEVNGLTLTSGTTYASFANFSGAAPAQTGPHYSRRDVLTKTSTKAIPEYQMYPTPLPSAGLKPAGNKTCVGLRDVTKIALPATVDPSSFIIPVTTDRTEQFKANAVPTQILQYLDGLSTVSEQMSGNKLETCSPTTAPPESTAITCTYVTTLPAATTVSTASCVPSINNGKTISICPNPFPSPIPPTAPASSQVTVTATVSNPPKYMPPSAPSSPVMKTSGLSILTETGSHRLHLPTGSVEPPAGGSPPAEGQDRPTKAPPYSGPTAHAPPPDQYAPPGDDTSRPDQPGDDGTSDEHPSGNGGDQGSKPNDTPSNNQLPGNGGNQGDRPGPGYATSPAEQNPRGSANSYIPPPIVDHGTTYTPSPITYTSAGSVITYYPAPATTTISGTAVFYYPTPYVSTSNGVPVTYYPPTAQGPSTSPVPPSYVPITIAPTEQGCTATVTVTYSPVFAGNLTSSTAGVGDYVHSGIDSGNAGVSSTALAQTGGAGRRKVCFGSLGGIMVGLVALRW